MNTFWLKVAGVAAVVVVLVIAASVFINSESKPKPKQKTVYEVWEEDDKRLRDEPESAEPPETSSPVQPATKPQPAIKPSPVEPRKPQFKKLSQVDEIEAQRKWEWVVNQRKMARLPVVTPKQMVDTCREIIRRWPESKYAFLAKRALADLPERYYKMYNITKEEMDISSFYK